MKKRVLTLLFFINMMLFSSDKKEILVAAASSLTDVMQEAGIDFEKKNQNIKVLFTFASSGVLRNQIEKGSPIDLFVFAGVSDGKLLEEKKLIKEGSLSIICANSMILAVNKRISSYNLSGFEALSDSRIKKIALGNFETVPAGKYAKALLSELNLLELIKDKIIFTENVRQALTYVELGNADAAIVYKTDFMISKNLVSVAEAAKVSGKEILYTCGITKTGENKIESAIFWNFLLSRQGKNIFTKYGFITK